MIGERISKRLEKLEERLGGETKTMVIMRVIIEPVLSSEDRHVIGGRQIGAFATIAGTDKKLVQGSEEPFKAFKARVEAAVATTEATNATAPMTHRLNFIDNLSDRSAVIADAE
jgi:hypothetical protein